MYGDIEPMTTEKEAELIKELKRKFEKDNQDAHQKANLNLILSPDNCVEDMIEARNEKLFEDDDPRINNTLKALTRDSEPSITVVCLHDINGRTCLDRYGKEEIDIEATKDSEAARQLVLNSVKISNWYVREELIKQNLPNSWRKNPHLRHLRYLILADGIYESDKFRLILDEELGLQIIGTKQI